ncbi:hypothetical protein K1719_018935 [Acacia pycnantha]|nr:hypothetical protein K1719_018935 [Acacia pycnantha]
MERKSLVVLFSILVLLLAAQEVVVKTEAKTCEKPSKFFSGGCVGTTGNTQCGYLCRRGEGLLSGACKGLKCVCTYGC